MADLLVSEEAEDELDALYDIHFDAAATVDALLVELEENDDLLERLCRPMYHFTASPPFEIKRYEEMWQRGRNIFTLKVQAPDGSWPPFRVLIGYHAQNNSYHVLAVLHREISYELNDPIFAAVLDRYERAGIPVYK